MLKCQFAVFHSDYVTHLAAATQELLLLQGESLTCFHTLTKSVHSRELFWSCHINFPHHSPQPEIRFSSNSSCWAQNLSLKWGCSLQGFTLSHQTDPATSPHCTEQPAWAAWKFPPVEVWDSCAPETLCTPEPTESRWGVTMCSRTDWSGQGRRGMEWQGVGSAEG